MEKKRVVYFINQFFGQIGGEEKADVGVSVTAGAVGPAVRAQSLFEDVAEVVATVICGDNYMAEKPEIAVGEALERIKSYKPDLFMAGPAFNAGRYGMNCGRLCEAVAEELNIPTVTGMYHENPAAEIYRKNKKGYILRTGINAIGMREVLPKMVSIAKRIFSGERIGGAEEEGYIKRDIIKNELTDRSAASRAIDMLLKKVKGEPFVTEMELPSFDKVDPAPPVDDIKKVKLALVSDGGVVPKGNPDKLRAFSSVTWGEYPLDDLFQNPIEVQHGGYDSTHAKENLNRLLPLEPLRAMEAEGDFAELYPNVFMAGGNCAAVSAAQDIGRAFARRLKEEGIAAAILTST